MAAMWHLRIRISHLIWLLIIPSGITSNPAFGQVALGRVAVPGENRATAARLAASAKLVADQEWTQAIDEYLQIQEESGDDLVPLDSRHSVSARRLCQKELANLPPEALRMYRDRVEGQAKKLFEQGNSERDARPLERLVNDFFCSRFADRALDMLGDLAFERGRFEEAESWWNMLAPPASRAAPQPDDPSRSFDLVYPEPLVNLARVKAKQLLARLFAGNRENWPEDLKAFRNAHGNQQGDLAGQRGNYADILEKLFNQSEITKAVSERRNRHNSWPTFAGSSSHNLIAPEAFRRLDYESPPWPIRIDGKPGGKGRPGNARTGIASSSRSQPLCYPVIAGDLVFISSSRFLSAYDVLTARRVGFFELENIVKSTESDGPASSGEREFTITISDNRLFAVLGNGAIPSGPNNQLRGAKVLVCLDLPPKPNGQFHVRWSRVAGKSNGPEKDVPAIWEGAPIVHDNQVYIAQTRSEKNHGLTFLECYDAESGQIRWRQEICLAAEDSNQGAPSRSHVLTLAGQCLVYCSDAGVIVAVNAATGRRLWAFHYSRRGPKTDNGDSSPRALGAVVQHSGRVFAAPADSIGVLCLNASTGDKLWERKDIEVVHLLGVAKGRLILTTAALDTPKAQCPAGIRALDAETGVDVRRWIQPADGTNLPSYGRGLLAGDWVFWPVLRSSENEPGVIILNQDDGSQPVFDIAQFWQVRAGNMALSKDCLATVDDKYLYVYVPPGRLLEQRENESRNSNSANDWHRLAMARADAGQSTKALDAFAHAETLVQEKELGGTRPLREQIRADWHHHLMTLAEQASKSHNREEADAFFNLAGGKDFTVSDRLRALTLQAISAGPSRAIPVCKTILQDNDLRQGWLIDSKGGRQQALWWAAIERVHDFPPPLASTPSLATPSNTYRSSTAGRQLTHKLPLTPCWSIPLSQKETFLGFSESSNCLFTYHSSSLVCREFINNEPRWVKRLADRPNWLANIGEAVLTAGPSEINMFNSADGIKLWSLSAPPIPWPHYPGDGELQHFCLVGSILIFFQGQQFLFGLNVETGQVLWERQAPGASLGLPLPATRFNPHFYAGEKGVIVQTSGGEIWILDPQTGNLIFEGPYSRMPWPRPPFAVDRERVLIFPDDQSLILMSVPTGRVLWKKMASQPSITARAPQVLVNDRSVFQLVDGWQLAQLSLDSGEKVWEKAIPNGPIEADLSAMDSDCFYFVSQGKIHAWSLSSHQPLWKNELPKLTVPWRLSITGPYLLLFPSQPPFTLRWQFSFSPLPMSFPFEMQWDDLPLVIIDKETGKIVQSSNFRGANAQSGVHFFKDTLVVALEDKIFTFRPSGIR
jgi:outer membrane protein assembly factor BamB